MNLPTSNLTIAVLAGLALSACGQKSAEPNTAADTATAAAENAPQSTDPHDDVQACKLITLEEMKAMLGAEVVATAEEGGGSTRCVWNPPSGGMPMAELKIEWGMAEAALTAMGMLSKHEPGINSPYDDLGDEAVVTGPVVMIKKDQDLFSIMSVGAGNPDAIIRKIYETAVARL